MHLASHFSGFSSYYADQNVRKTIIDVMKYQMQFVQVIWASVVLV